MELLVEMFSVHVHECDFVYFDLLMHGYVTIQQVQEG
jgi:hypothetical protein